MLIELQSYLGCNFVGATWITNLDDRGRSYMSMSKNNDWSQEKLIQLSGGHWQAFAIHAAIELDLFTLLDSGLKTSKEMAHLASYNQRACEMLLNALCAMDLLVKIDGNFTNTPFASEFLSKNSEAYTGYIIGHHHHLVDSWNNLASVVRTGEPHRSSTSHTNSEIERENFLMGMFNMAFRSRLAPRWVEKINLAKAQSILDLGGGPGTYAIYFCQNNAQMSGTVFDLPTTAPFAEKTIARFTLNDRINFIGGDFTVNDIPGKYDAVLLSHILHGMDEKNCQLVISKAAKALNPNGVFLIHEFILNDEKSGPLFPALFSLNMLVGTTGGQSYSKADLIKMLSNAGISQIEHLTLEDKTPS